MNLSNLVFTLPSGFVDDNGALHSEVELSPLTGREEEYLSTVVGTIPSTRVITELLRRCMRRLGSLPAISDSVAREMVVGDREYVVMRLREMTWGSTVNAILRCPAEDCSKPMDVTLSLRELVVEPHPVMSRYFRMRLSSEPSREIEFRLPTGADQEALVGIEDERRAISALLARCTTLDESEVDALSETARCEIEEQIEKRAPQADIELEATCPECRRLCHGQAGWPAYCLSDMVSQSAMLEHDIHCLAWHYHWSESEVLSMTRVKRRRYVALIEEELARMSGA
jgi:hypothetical protein